MLSIIVATSENNVIGRGNKIPWRMPRDQKYFSDVTAGHTVIMGRNTYESIMSTRGKPLPNRNNIVVTRQKDFKAPGCTVVHSLDEAIRETSSPPLLSKPARTTVQSGGEGLGGGNEIFNIGGSQLYAEGLPKTDKIYRTLIHTTLDGDVFFPPIDPAQFKLVDSKFEPKDDKNPFDATYEIYIRRT